MIQDIELASRIIAENPKFVATDDDLRNPAFVAQMVLDRMEDEAESLLGDVWDNPRKALQQRLGSYGVRTTQQKIRASAQSQN